MDRSADDAVPVITFPPDADNRRPLPVRQRSPAELVRRAVADHLGVPVLSVSLQHRLAEDLFIGGLGRVLIGLELEAQEGHGLPLDGVWELRTVHDLVDLVTAARLKLGC